MQGSRYPGYSADITVTSVNSYSSSKLPTATWNKDCKHKFVTFHKMDNCNSTDKILWYKTAVECEFRNFCSQLAVFVKQLATSHTDKIIYHYINTMYFAILHNKKLLIKFHGLIFTVYGIVCACQGFLGIITDDMLWCEIIRIQGL